MAISKKIRFEIFKRDDFACQYCGCKTPQVVLEVDHIIPVSEGGGDHFDNLTTACFDCNRGKGKALLEEYREGTDPTEQAILLLERERQLQEYNEVLKKVRSRKNGDYLEATKYWNKTFPTMKDYWFPSGTIRKALDYIPKEMIFEAIDICNISATKWEDKSWGESIRAYFCGIIRKMTQNFGKGE